MQRVHAYCDNKNGHWEDLCIQVMGNIFLLHLMMQCALPIKSMALNFYWSSIIEHMHHNHDFYSSSIDTDDKLYFVLGVYKNVMYWGNVCMISLIDCCSGGIQAIIGWILLLGIRRIVNKETPVRTTPLHSHVECSIFVQYCGSSALNRNSMSVIYL